MITTLAVSVLALFAPPGAVHEKAPVPKATPPAIVQPAPLVELATFAAVSYMPFPFDLDAYYPNLFYDGQCTAFVASHKQIPWSGNANAWDDNARSLGITVSDIPVIGSIAQTDRGEWGHVALVLDVANGMVLIREQNYDYNGSIRDRWAEPSEFSYIWY